MDRAPSLEDTARLAIDGDRDALDVVVRELQGDVYGIALRMLWNKEDAEDATQEILVRIVTRLSQFDFRSRLRTWAFRVAVNYVLDVKKSATERLHMGFETLSDGLLAGLTPDGPADAERSVLVEEIKISCSLAMLQCLDRPHRLAYILGDVMDLPGPEAAEALGVSPELFRKRLQHARAAVLGFTRQNCGLVSDEAPCRCSRQVAQSVRTGRVVPGEPAFAAGASSFNDGRALVRKVDEARRAIELHRTSHPRASVVDFARRTVAIFDRDGG